MHAAIPAYPQLEMTKRMNAVIGARIFSRSPTRFYSIRRIEATSGKNGT